MIFFWKKYEGDGLATFISMIGSIVVVGIAVLAGVAAMTVTKTLLGETGSSILCIIVGVGALIGLKILLNKLTDAIDRKYQDVAGKIAEKSFNTRLSKEAKAAVVLRTETDQKALVKTLRKCLSHSFSVPMEDTIAGIKRLTDQDIVHSLISYNARVSCQFGTNQVVGERPQREMAELIARLNDEGQRERLLTHYGIPENIQAQTKAQAPQSATAPAPAQTNLRQLVDTFAHYESFSVDRTEETKMADELVAGGNESLNIIMAYLLSCARGSQKEYWWSNAAGLVRLIGRFPNVDHASQYKRLMDCQSNIWEYQTQIKDVAEQELLKLKKADPSHLNSKTISAEDAQAELKQLDGIYNAEARLKAAIAMKDSVEGWSDDMKAFYYYIIGRTLRQQDPKDERQYAFYAAQLFYNPIGTSLGWHELLKLDEFKELKPTPENARMLHERFPLPASFEGLVNG